MSQLNNNRVIMMKQQWIDIPSHDSQSFKGYLSLPPTGTGPGIVLIQEIFGVNEHIRAVADQWAMDGYVVLAPDVFWRQKPGLDIGYDDAGFKEGLALLQGLDFGLAVEDLGSAVNALKARMELKGGVASLGFCMGGALSYLSAASAGVDAAVCYYGGGIQNMLDKVSSIHCPILLHFAEKDSFIPSQAVESVKQAFKGKSNAQVMTYPDVDHGFNCWGRPMYNQHAAALARSRSLEFLAEHL